MAYLDLNGTTKLWEKIKALFSTHTTNKSNPHGVTASQISAVPTSRTVNGKALSSNITLTATDISAVPTSRTVNGKALSSNITLTATDIGAAPSSSATTIKSYTGSGANRTITISGTKTGGILMITSKYGCAFVTSEGYGYIGYKNGQWSGGDGKTYAYYDGSSLRIVGSASSNFFINENRTTYYYRVI